MWNMRPWRASPLMRASYRVESLLHIVAVLLIALAVPVAATLATSTYTARVQQADRAAAAVHQVRATLDETPNPRDIIYGVAAVRVHWSYNGTTHSGETIADAKAKAGDPAQVWVNDKGEQAPKPPTHAQALPDAIALGIGSFGLFTALVLTLWHLLGWFLDRRRCAHWSRQWAALAGERKWNHL
jgi:hypothetical protein